MPKLQTKLARLGYKSSDQPDCTQVRQPRPGPEHHSEARKNHIEGDGRHHQGHDPANYTLCTTVWGSVRAME